MHRLWIALLATSCSIVPAIANPRVSDPAEALPAAEAPLRVRLYVRSAVPHAALGQARRRTQLILSGAGVGTEFLLCDQRELPLPAACDAPFAPDEIAMRILPQPVRKDGALGYALPSAEGKIGRYVSIFVVGVAELAAAKRLRHGELLGHVMAHEIGHLLLGYGAHSRRGLMRADWSVTDLARINDGGLWFSAGEARRLRAFLSAR